jgi:hypothetical protein
MSRSYVHKYSGRRVSTLFKFEEAVSPHVAARGSKLLVSDSSSFTADCPDGKLEITSIPA